MASSALTFLHYQNLVNDFIRQLPAFVTSVPAPFLEMSLVERKVINGTKQQVTQATVISFRFKICGYCSCPLTLVRLEAVSKQDALQTRT